MQMLNGAAHPKSNHLDAEIPEQEKSIAARTRPPAETISFGRVVTRIWANRNSWGDITWKVDQIQLDYSGTRRNYHGHYYDDLKDAVRGLYAARQWIRRTEKRRTRRWFWRL